MMSLQSTCDTYTNSIRRHFAQQRKRFDTAMESGSILQKKQNNMIKSNCMN